MMRYVSTFLAILVSAVLFVGCDSGSDTAGSKDGHDHGAHDHDHDHGDHDHGDHDHDHDHAELGPNKGHLVSLDTDDYVAEWKHYDGNSIIRVFVLNDKKEAAKVKANVTITPDGGKSTDPFVLVGENADADGKTSSYMLDKDELSIAMNLGVKLTIEIDGKTYTGKIAAHKPHAEH